MRQRANSLLAATTRELAADGFKSVSACLALEEALGGADALHRVQRTLGPRVLRYTLALHAVNSLRHAEITTVVHRRRVMHGQAPVRTK